MLEWKGIRRDPMPPGRWTALFFLDEATALAAGHRPCAYCRRADFLSFTHAWRSAAGLPNRPRAAEIDAQLHVERVDSRSRRQLTRRVAVADLPDGAMIRHAGAPGLLRAGTFLPWSFQGYQAGVQLARAARVELLTPPSTVATIAAGYRPVVHPSADPSRCPAGTPGGPPTGAGWRA